MKHIWLIIEGGDIAIERQQLIDEGRDIASVSDALSELEQADPGANPAKQREAEALLDATATLPMRSDCPYEEPNELDAILEQRNKDLHSAPVSPPPDEALQEKLLGAWQGRCSGCLLGKPVEGWRSEAMWGYLRDLGRFPLNSYFRSDAPEAVVQKHGVHIAASCVDKVDCMPEDDDTNYTVLALKLLREHGPDFTTLDVANAWLANLPILHTCTAERVAYRNLALLVPPPESARRRNPYREWIGAQIRADAYGYVVPGDPEQAAKMAWRDACVSHVKNGIYGAMWVAAMTAAAAVESSPETVIRAGLGQIPVRSRLSEAITDVLAWRDEGIDAEQAIARVHERWDEHNPHHWCHTISNAQIVALGLLWGEANFARSICLAVQACFDTDCNGATVGSIVGMMLGTKRLPEEWIAPLNDTLITGVADYSEVRISDLARETFALVNSFASVDRT